MLSKGRFRYLRTTLVYCSRKKPVCGLGFSFYAVTGIFSSIQTYGAIDYGKINCLTDLFASKTTQIIVEHSSSLFPSLFNRLGSHSVS
jgi:hypothetical protein